MGLFASYDPVWTILMIFVICHKLWMILTILFCDLLWRIKCPRTDFPTASLDIIVCQFVSSQVLRVTVRPSDALGLKATGKQKGRISPMWCGRSSPKHNLCWGKFVHLENLLFTLCECFLLKISDAYRFIFIYFIFYFIKNNMHPSFTVYLSLTPRFPCIIKLYMVASQKKGLSAWAK